MSDQRRWVGLNPNLIKHLMRRYGVTAPGVVSTFLTKCYDEDDALNSLDHLHKNRPEWFR